MEADAKHRRLLLDALGLDETSGSLTHNGEGYKSEADSSEELFGSDATAYRALCARLNFLSQDCPDLQYPAKELSRSMSRPTVGAWARLKKTARFLVHRQRVVWTLHFKSNLPASRFTQIVTGGGVGIAASPRLVVPFALVVIASKRGALLRVRSP